jgi:hypothetical protein
MPQQPKSARVVRLLEGKAADVEPRGNGQDSARQRRQSKTRRLAPQVHCTLGEVRHTPQGGIDLANVHPLRPSCGSGGQGRDTIRPSRWKRHRIFAPCHLARRHVPVGLCLLEAKAGGVFKPSLTVEFPNWTSTFFGSTNNSITIDHVPTPPQLACLASTVAWVGQVHPLYE